MSGHTFRAAARPPYLTGQSSGKARVWRARLARASSWHQRCLLDMSHATARVHARHGCAADNGRPYRILNYPGSRARREAARTAAPHGAGQDARIHLF